MIFNEQLQRRSISNHADQDLKTGDKILCSAYAIKNNDKTEYYPSLIQSITQDHVVERQLSLEAGQYDNIAEYCCLPL
ncbi:hypothetical protein OXYTRIMIC_469 [Oxytricha trifallax]|uniref:Uncharacterized protein n=1 Tax=Oxytricha trifallax TaxID=1172189 RepID=A0A073IBW4_9SPIT|nr:hypothetical protein OXYTRIMIC_469 [Oxytricha trifallax]